MILSFITWYLYPRTLIHHGYESTTQNLFPIKSIYSATHFPPHSWPTKITRYLYPRLFIHHGYGSNTQNPCHRNPFAWPHTVNITVDSHALQGISILYLHASWLQFIHKSSVMGQPRKTFLFNNSWSSTNNL